MLTLQSLSRQSPGTEYIDRKYTSPRLFHSMLFPACFRHQPYQGRSAAGKVIGAGDLRRRILLGTQVAQLRPLRARRLKHASMKSSAADIGVGCTNIRGWVTNRKKLLTLITIG
jgi:hypothetical protein